MRAGNEMSCKFSSSVPLQTLRPEGKFDSQFYVLLVQARDSLEEGISTDMMSLSEWPLEKPVVHIFD